MTEKRFDYTHYDDGTESIYDREEDEYYFNTDLDKIGEILNELHEENQSIKKHIGELYKIVKFDVGNEIEGYPKVLLEYIVNILKIIGDEE